MASCGNTRPVEKADSEITYLRALKAGKHRPDISGSVLRNYRAANTEWIPLIKCVVSRALRSAFGAATDTFVVCSRQWEL